MVLVQHDAALALLPQAWHIDSAAGNFCKMLGLADLSRVQTLSPCRVLTVLQWDAQL
jgi:hypothetical protein